MGNQITNSLPAPMSKVYGSLVGPQRLATGAQLCVLVDGEPVVDFAGGSTLDGPLLPEHLHSVFCLTKPLAALAVGRLIDEGHFALQTCVEEIIGPLSFVPPSTTVESVLNHSAGLVTPLAIQWRLCPPSERAQLLQRTRNLPSPSYSEVAGGLVVESIIHKCTGADANLWTTAELLEPYGIDSQFVLDPGLAASALIRERVRVPFGGQRRLPLLSERLPAQLSECRLAFGALASARGIAAVMELWRKALRSEDGPVTKDTVDLLVSARRGEAFDTVIQRSADFAAGVAVNVSQHQLGTRLSSTAVGGVAGASIAAGVADPELNISVGLYLNRAIFDNVVLAAEARSRIIDAAAELAR